LRLIDCPPLGHGLVVLTALVACAGTPTQVVSVSPPAAPPAVAGSTTLTGKSTPIDEPSGPPNGLPNACARAPTASDPLCTPPADFVERLCGKPHQDAALGLFAPQAPFTRVYVRGRIDELAADEEVIVLRFHAPRKEGIVVGNNKGSYDVLRWDGTCSIAVEAEVITRTRPVRPTTAHLQWHRVSPRLQDALVAGSDAVKRAHAKRGKECKGAMSGDVSASCEKADAALVAAIVEYVRKGGIMPDSDDVL